MTEAQHQRAKARIQYRLGLRYQTARLADDGGGTYVTGRPGYARVEYQKSENEFLPATEVLNATGVQTPGVFVLIGWRNQQDMIIAVDAERESARGSSPQATQENNELKWVPKGIITEFKPVPISTTEIAVSPGWLPNGLYFAGAQTTTLTTAIGNLSTGEKQIAGVYIKTDATLETKLSTAIDVLDPFSVDHLAEIQAAASVGSVPVVGVELVVGLTDITDAYFHWDLRILFGALGGGAISYSADDVSNPPTDTELDTVFGTPAEVGAGFVAVLDDDGADTTVYLIASNGTSWWYSAAMTKAT